MEFDNLAFSSFLFEKNEGNPITAFSPELTFFHCIHSMGNKHVKTYLKMK